MKKALVKIMTDEMIRFTMSEAAARPLLLIGTFLTNRPFLIWPREECPFVKESLPCQVS